MKLVKKQVCDQVRVRRFATDEIRSRARFSLNFEIDRKFDVPVREQIFDELEDYISATRTNNT